MQIKKTTKKIRYHIFDDFGELLRISLDKPSENVQYEKHVEKTVEVLFDTDDFEEALF